jgi:hypothetical protein
MIRERISEHLNRSGVMEERIEVILEGVFAIRAERLLLLDPVVFLIRLRVEFGELLPPCPETGIRLFLQVLHPLHVALAIKVAGSAWS